MSFYEDTNAADDSKDLYYKEQSEKAIAEALERCTDQSPEGLRRAIRRSYPFGPLRSGRPYKIFRKLMLAAEASLGLEPKRHRK